MSGVQSRIDDFWKKKKQQEESHEKSVQPSTSAVDERINQFWAQKFTSSLPKRLSTLQESKNQMYKSYNSRFTDGNGNYKNTYRGDTADALSAFNSSRTAYESDSKKFLDELAGYEKYLDAEQVKKIKDALADNSDLDDLYKAYQGDHDYFSQWENEEAYNYSVSKAEKQKKYSKMSDDELEKELKKLKNTEKENKLVSGVGDVLGKALSGLGINSDEAKNTTDDLKNKSVDATTDVSLLQKEISSRKLKTMDSLPDDVKKLIEEYTELDAQKDETTIENIGKGFQRAFNKNTGGFTPETTALRRKEIADALETAGVENWQELVEYNRIRRDEEKNKAFKEETKEFATEHPWISSATTILTSPTKMLGAVEMLESAVAGSGAPLNYNSPYFTGNNFVNTTRETVMENYDWEGPKTNIDWFDQIYSTAMSTGDSLLNMALTGGTKLGGAVLGATAMSDTAQEVARNGGSKEQALLTGIVAGVNEMVWENISIGNFKGMAEKGIKNLVSKKGIKTLAGNILKSVGVNASEEFNTEAANIIVDYLVNGGLSSYAQAYDAYRQGGYTETEARKKARTDMINQTVMSGVGGAMQGLLMGGAGSALGGALSKSQYNQQAKDMSPEEITALQMRAAELGVKESDINVNVEDVGPWGETGRVSEKKISNLLSVVEDAEAESTKNELVKEAKKYGINTTQFNLKKDEGVQALASAIAETEERIQTEVNQLSDSIYKNALKERLVSLGENESTANYMAENLIKKKNGESLDSYRENSTKAKSAEIAYNELLSVGENAPQWVKDTEAQINSAGVDLIKTYTRKATAETTPAVHSETTPESAPPTPMVEMPPVVSKAAENFAAQFDNSQKQKAARRLYVPALDRNVGFKSAFDAYYNAGLKGIGSFEAIDKYYTYAHSLPLYWRKNVFSAGRENKVYNPGVNAFYQSKLTATQKNQVRIMDAIGKEFGISFIVFDRLKDNGEELNGMQLSGTNKILVSLDAEGKLYLRTAGHECFHLIEEWNPAEAEKLTEKVIGYLKNTEGYDYSARVTEYANRYGVDVNTADGLKLIHSEMAADSMFDVFSNEEFVKDLVEKNRTLAQKLKDILQNFLKQLRNMISEFKGSAEMNALREQTEVLEEIRSSFHNALRVASTEMQKNLQNEQKNSASRTDITEKAGNGVRYSKKDYFIEDKYFKSVVSKWDELTHGQYVKVGVVGNNHPLVKIGMPAGILRYDVSKIETNLKVHNDYLNIDLLKIVPDIIFNPIAISEYSAENTVSVFGNYFIGGSPMMVGITISKDRAGNDITKVRTFNARKDVGSLVTDEKVLYLNEDKKRTQEWFQACGIQVPLGGTQFGFIRSISQKTENSNTQNRKSIKLMDSEYISAVEKGDMETAQKLVDEAANLWGAYSEDGKPVKFSHGTKGDGFTVFEKGDIGFHFGTREQAKTKAGYITPEKTANPFFLDEDNEIKTGKIISAYLKMENPLTFSRDLGEWTVPRMVGYFEALLNNKATIEIEKYDRKKQDFGWEKVNPKEISEVFITEEDRAELEGIKMQYERDSLSHIGEELKDYTYSSRSTELLRDFLISKGYDSLKYLNEYEGKVNDYSYAVFFSNQIKSADAVTYDDNGEIIPLSERFKDDKKDIRYSLKMSSSAREALESNPELKLVFENLQKQMKHSEGYIPDGKRIHQFAVKLRKDVETTLPVAELESDLQSIYKVLASIEDSEGYEYAWDLTVELAQKMLTNSRVLDDLNAEKKDLRERLTKYLKGRKFYLSPSMKAEIESYYDTYGNYHRKIFGRGFSFSENATTTLESEWNDLCAELPELFDPETHVVDQPIALLEAFNATEWQYGLFDEYQYDSQVNYTATEIMNALTDIPTTTTLLDRITERQYNEIASLNAENRKKIQELKQQFSENMERMSSEAEARYRLQIKKNMEQKKATEVRGQIEKQIVRLSDMLAHGKKNRHIPLKLIDAVRDLCYSVTLNRASQNKLGENLGIIEASYLALKQGSDGPDGEQNSQFLMNAYDEYVYGLIQNLGTTLQHKSVANMTLAELIQVNETVKAVAQRVTRANELHIESRNEGVEETANAIGFELGSPKVKREYSWDVLNKASDKGDVEAWKFLKPVYAWRMIGSETLGEIMGNIRAGEDTWAVDMYEAKEKIDALAEKYNKKTWEKGKIEVELSSGTYSFSIQQLMMLYVASQREQYIPHLLGEHGGFVFEDAYKTVESIKDGTKKKPKVYRKRDAGTHRLSEEDLEIVAKTLTAEQKGYANEMRDYLARDLAVKGNEITRVLYDMNKFVEDKYFPIKVSRRFLDGTTKEPEVRSVLSQSMLKDLQEDASNPVLLRDFDTVWAEHVQQMAMFHSFALPLDDFKRVFDFRTTKGKAISIKDQIETACGKGAISYIENFIKDVNGGVRAQNGAELVNTMISKFKKGAVFASASVTIQQPSAIARAIAVIDPKYFTTPTLTNKDYEELMKYAPIARIKSMGFFDTNIGQSSTEWLTSEKYSTKKEKLGAFFSTEDSSYRDELLSKAPEVMDEITWCNIWHAVKKETAVKTGLTGEELLKKSGKRFAEVIELTQVYDSVFSKSELMRSRDTGVKMMTAFMAEPTVSLNMLVDAAVQAKKGNLKGGGRYIGAFVASVVLNNILKALVTAPRDDDEEKTLIEKYIAKVVGGIGSELHPIKGPMSLIPIAKDIVSIFDGYSIERADMALVQNLYDAIKDLSSDKKSGIEKGFGVAGALAAFLGVPLKNITRDLKAVGNLVFGMFTIGDTSAEGIKQSVKEDSSDSLWNKYIKKIIFGSSEEQLYSAIKSGDYSAYEKLQKGEYGGDSKKVNAAIREGLVKGDERVTLAAQARLNGDFYSYDKYVREIAKDGFSNENVVKAVNTVYNKLTEEEDEEAKEKFYSLYSSEDLNNALETGGDYETVIEDMIEASKKNGSTQKDAESAVKTRIASYWKEVYFNASVQERKDIEELLDDTGLYRDIEETTSGWVCSILKEEYLAATSTAERNQIKQEIWKSGFYSTRKAMNNALEKLFEGTEEE